jgi:small neutral amino acid transporter SnatA (MarC family)
MKDSEDEPSDARRPVGDPLAELEDRARVKGSTTASVTIGLVVIGMMMVAVGSLLILPINLSLEHARIMGGLAFFVVGVSVIFSVAQRASI